MKVKWLLAALALTLAFALGFLGGTWRAIPTLLGEQADQQADRFSSMAGLLFDGDGRPRSADQTVDTVRADLALHTIRVGQDFQAMSERGRWVTLQRIRQIDPQREFGPVRDDAIRSWAVQTIACLHAVADAPEGDHDCRRILPDGVTVAVDR